jgi:hypothetical protein
MQRTDNWTRFAIVQLYGSYFVGKVFALIGGPLVALLIFHRNLSQSVFKALIRKDPLSFVAWTLLVSIMYGVCEVIYGFLSGYDPITALQILVFNLCPIYFFLGIWAGARRPNFLQGFIKFSFWFTTFYTLLYFLFLRKMGGDFGHPGSGLVVFLAPFCFDFSISVYWFPILVATFNMIAAQIRADWAGLGIALAIWGVATRRLGRVFSIAGVLVGLLLFGFIFDIRMPGFSDRGGEISARDTVGRALSSFDPELASEYSSDTAVYAGTVKWRETWWREIRETVSQSPTTIIFGMGYGYPIGDLVSYLKGMDIRTPHSIYYFTLCYSGALGVMLFFLLQASILTLHWRTYKATGQIFGFVSHTSLLVSAFFGNVFEAPQAAIPLYLIFGMSVGPLFSQRYMEEQATDLQEISIPPIPKVRIRMRGYSPVSNPASD